MKISNQFEVDTTTRCLVVVFLLLIRCVTFDLFTLVSGRIWRVTWLVPPPSLKIIWLSILELWVLTSPIGYHWQCVGSHCAVSCHLCFNFSHIFGKIDGKRARGRQRLTFLGWLEWSTGIKPLDLITKLQTRRQWCGGCRQCQESGMTPGLDWIWNPYWIWNLPIHYTTFMVLRWCLRVVYLVNLQC